MPDPPMEMTVRADEFHFVQANSHFPLRSAHFVRARLRLVANRWQFIASNRISPSRKGKIAVRDGISPNEKPFPAGEVAVHIGESAFRVTSCHF